MESHLRELVDQRLSASDIAKALNWRFNRKMSRNAITGKCGRLGLQLRGEPKPWGIDRIVQFELDRNDGVLKKEKNKMTPNYMEVILVKLMKGRGYIIDTPSWSGDRIAIPRVKVAKLNLTELSKDLIKELET
jgi:hypothetical protein